MNKKIALLCKTLIRKLISSIKRFPEAILLAACVVSILIYINHFRSDLAVDTIELLKRIAMVLALGIPLSLCIKTLFERIPSLKRAVKVLIYACATGGLLLYYLFLLKDLEMVAVTRYIAFSIALYFSFTFIPYFYKKENYELYVKKLFTSFFITYLYSMVLFLGLAAMLFTIDALFSVNLSQKLYFDIWLVVAGVFAPAYFLADIPEYGEDIYTDSYPKVLKVLLLYIVMPLLIAYSAILYVYFAKIVLTRQWPDGLVSNLVLWYSIISILILFFIYPLRKTNQWVKTFVSIFPKLIIPLLAMMFVSMGIRIKAYGITENRYFVILAGSWVTASMLYYIIKRDIRNIFLPISVALIAALSVTGPWSAYSISKLSQNARFENILEKHGMISDNEIIKPANELPVEDKREISAIIRYFDRYHKLDDIRYIPEDFSTKQMEEIFGFEYNTGIKETSLRNYFSYHITENDMFLKIGEFDYFADFTVYASDSLQITDRPVSISYSHQTRQLHIVENGHEIYSSDLPDIANRLYGHPEEEKKQMNMSEMTYTDQNQNVKVLYLFKHIHGWKDKWTNNTEIESMEFYVFVKIIK